MFTSFYFKPQPNAPTTQLISKAATVFHLPGVARYIYVRYDRSQFLMKSEHPKHIHPVNIHSLSLGAVEFKHGVIKLIVQLSLAMGCQPMSFRAFRGLAPFQRLSLAEIAPSCYWCCSGHCPELCGPPLLKKSEGCVIQLRRNPKLGKQTQISDSCSNYFPWKLSWKLLELCILSCLHRGLEGGAPLLLLHLKALESR